MWRWAILAGMATMAIALGEAAAQNAPMPPIPMTSPAATPVPPPTYVPAPPGAPAGATGQMYAAGNLPTMPYGDPRPMEGQQPGQQFQLRRAGDAAAPMAGFVDSLRGNDAVIEIVVGQGRLLTLKSDLSTQHGRGVVAVGDPTVAEFVVLPEPRILRLLGLRAGVTDLSVTTADGQNYNFELRVVYDLPLLRAQLRQLFPDAQLQLTQLRDHLVVEGQARSPVEVANILTTLEAYLASIQVKKSVKGESERDKPEASPVALPAMPAAPGNAPAGNAPAGNAPGGATPGAGGPSDTKVEYAKAQIVNLIRVPGVHQVMLQVRIAELNRTAIRNIGGDFVAVSPRTGNLLGTNIGGATVSAESVLGLGGLSARAGTLTDAANTQAFGIFPTGNFELLVHALRKNSMLSILAEPNLVAISGHHANFLAGGEFPVPVPQVMGGVSNSVTIEWKRFGVQLDFEPYVLEDNVIRLAVTPEVSTVDFSLGVTLVSGGSPIPGINSRKATTTVEMRQGQTLAIAGLLQVTLDGTTTRIPGLGDLPYIGPMFSNTSHQRVEKELVVLVTPHLVAPMNPDQVGPLPGREVKDPNDLEFYLLNRIEGRTGRDEPASRGWEDPLHLLNTMRLEQRCVLGPVGVSE